MLQIRSSLDVADNTGAKIAWAIGVLGRNQTYAGIGDVIKGALDDIKDIALNESGFIADGNDKFALGKVGHNC